MAYPSVLDAGPRVRGPAWRRSAALIAIGAITVSLLGGCAAQLAYRDGKDLVDSGKVEEGMRKLGEAINRDPSNVQYRQTYLQLRDRSSALLCKQGDQKLQAGDYVAAKRLYQRALEIDSGNERAIAGALAIETATRHVKVLAEAQAAWSKQDQVAADLKLREILDENPGHAGAQALMRTVRDATAPLPLEAGLSSAYHKPITLEFKDASIKQIFELLSRTSGLNFLFDKDVKTDARTSVYLKKGTVESALHFLLLTNQLDQQIVDRNTVLIYPNTAGKQKDYQELLVRSFYLANAEAKNVANTLKTLLKLQDVVVDEKLNMVLLRESPEAIRLAEKIVALHDIAEPEVMLEVEILEIKRSQLLNLGVQWPQSIGLSPLAAAGGTGLTLNDLRNLNRDRIGVSISPVTVNAKKQDTDANILANPRIRARNHEKAKILIGDRVPNITTTSTATGFVSDSISYVDVGLKLEVEPTIYLDGNVAIRIALEVSNIVSQLQTKTGVVAYQIGTRNASTMLSLKDGENQVLAGLINSEDRKSADKIPLIGEIPLLNRLFGNTTSGGEKTEIVLSITPHLVRNIQRPARDVVEFASGTGSTFRLRPDSRPHATGYTAAAKSAADATASPTTGAGTTANASPADANGAAEAVAPAPNADTPDLSGGQVHLEWSGPTQTRVGDTFSLRLMMQAGSPVSRLPLVLNVDPKLLQPIVSNEGSFLKKGDAKTHYTSQIEPNGQVHITIARAGAGVTGEQGDVMAIDFRALAPAAAAHVQLLSAAPSGADGKAISVKMPETYSIAVQP
ncbi:MAG TPA: secretin N-terminal domain-containing protein [Duganella sp.]|nr:secretin N-terminal domain-containing protein [Duganella sp.]